MGLDYYSPYVSGVTEAARVIAEGLAARGWRVLVVCSHHDPASPRTETIRGVDVIRTKVIARIGKGVISPTLITTIVREGRRARMVHLHAPMLESGPIALALRRRVPLVLTYQCDVNLSDSVLDRLQVAALDRSHRAAVRHSDRVVVSSDDYARHSRLAADFGDGTVEIPPPGLVRRVGEPTLRDGNGLHVGFLGRIVEEKGIDYLVAGFRELDADARLIIGGDFSKIAGGSVVDKVKAAIGDDPRIRLLGFVPDDQVSDFYASLDVFALTSINSLEAYGIVQVEAMMLGIPALATDLPGVRQPVERTGFGGVVPPRDGPAIAAGLRRLQASDLDRAAGAAAARELYSADTVITMHQELFDEILGRT